MRLIMLAFAASVAALTAPAMAQGPDSGGPIDIALSNFKFEPSTITLRHGQPYILHLTNNAGGAHDFVAKAFFAAATIDPRDRAKIVNGGVDVDGKSAVEIRVVAPSAGKFDFHCSHFMHSTFGMTGEIVVQ
jgi:uncharacterized cupredoxin-like copper-binding protein